MIVKSKIIADLTRPNFGGGRVHAVQGDGNTRYAEITLQDGGNPWTPPDGVDVAICYYQPDGHKGMYNKLADDSAAIAVSGNVATVILAPQMLTVSGTVQASLVFNDANLNRLTTFPFSVSVTANPAAGAQKTEDYIRLQWLEDKLTEYLAEIKASGAFDGKPGRDGVDGKDGAPGADGHTPEYGVDYGTQEQIAGIAQSAAEILQPEVNQINDDLTDLAIRTVVSKNIFDGMQEMIAGKVITGADTTSDNSNYDSTKNFIDIGFGNGGKKLYPYSNYAIRALAEYDESYYFIGITNHIGIGGVSLNERTRYVRVSIPKETESVYMLSIDELLTEYQQYKEVMLVKQENINIDAVLGSVSENIGVGMSVIPDDIKTVTGIFNADGTINGNYSTYVSTDDFIPVRPSQTYTIGGYDEGRGSIILAAFRAYLFFDKEKKFLSGWSQGSGLPNTITVPDNCYYIKVSYSKTLFSEVYLSEGNSKPESVPVYNPVKRIKPVFETSTEYIKNKWFGKTIVGLGDSITQADGCEMGWIHRVANMLGMRCYNHGINGSTIAVKESDPTNRNPMVTRYESLPDADILLTLAGSNDWYYAWTPIGTMDDRTNYTLYGALHNLITGLMQKYENGNIVFATPIKRGNSATLVNAHGKTLEEYCDIIKEVCAYYGVPCIDSNKFVQMCPFIDWQNEKYFLDVSDGQGGRVHDRTHPNDLGHEKIANYFVSQIRSLFY